MKWKNWFGIRTGWEQLLCFCLEIRRDAYAEAFQIFSKNELKWIWHDSYIGVIYITRFEKRNDICNFTAIREYPVGEGKIN